MHELCDIMNVSRSGYYQWLGRPASQGDQRRDGLVEQVRQVHAASRGLYGSPRICAELNKRGVKVSENTVAKLMRTHGIRSKIRRRFRACTPDSGHAHPVAANHLNRAFDPTAINRVWCTDLTYVPTDEGWLYLAVVLDLGSRRIVGRALGEDLKADLCLAALHEALRRRRPPSGLLHHSDRGVQYACEAYQAVLARYGSVCSMSRKGNPYDNAVAESFFSTFKRELVHLEHYATREQARQSILDYIDGFYNPTRLHSTLGYLSPVEFEASLE